MRFETFSKREVLLQRKRKLQKKADELLEAEQPKEITAYVDQVGDFVGTPQDKILSVELENSCVSGLTTEGHTTMADLDNLEEELREAYENNRVSSPQKDPAAHLEVYSDAETPTQDAETPTQDGSGPLFSDDEDEDHDGVPVVQV